MDGNSNDKRTDRQNMPIEDVDAIAKARGTTRAKVLSDIDSGALLPQDRANADQQNGDERRQEGYSETQGAGDDGQSQDTDATQAQSGYDPAHSGVRHAQNQPGTRPQTPGRETGTAWGEDQQMGTTTDTPDRKNPAG